MMWRRSAVFMLTLIACNAFADQKPQWEAGVGATVLRFADYRGSDEFKSYLFPIPYYVYRGEKIKVDRESVRGQFFKSDRVEIDVSGNITVPLKSKDNAARAGMQDLGATFEIGPALNLTLLSNADRSNKLTLKLPVHAVIESDFRYFRSAGVLFKPYFNWDVKNVANSGWNFGTLVGPHYHSRQYNEFLYGVRQEYATPTRRAYKARGGYGGSSITSGVSRRFDKLWVGAFARVDNLSGAAFEDSPLIRKRTFASFGIAASWVFAESKTRVEADD